ncbi:MAG TPA: efflux RND transporter periplasmic adaptor subunit, partial [Opitutaceae bacterium]|nr:efflux RND transporter periplasmic adaptor subunit [Opitutaceae bacterium]
MNRKSLLVLVIVLVAGVAFLLVRRGGSTAGDSNDEDQPVATLVTVQVGQLRPATLHAYVDGYGTVEPAPASADAPAASARVAPPLAGVVKRVHVAEGQQVRRGARLVDLDDRAAEVTVKYAAESAARQKELYAQHNTSLKALQDAEAQLATARAQLALLHVTAPLAGTVTALNARPGEAVDLTTVLAEITDLSRLVVS